MPALGDLIDLNNPQGHCNQAHNHDDNSYDDWRDALVWQTNDTGFNEGAGTALAICAKAGLNASLPEPVANLLGGAAGNLWRRREMIRFASDVAKKGHGVEATAIAVAGQWHNCHAFRALVRHQSDVQNWLLSH
jgi:alkylhydroperoxidase family enzyme